MFITSKRRFGICLSHYSTHECHGASNPRQRAFSLLAIWCQRPWVWILHSAEEDNLSPFDSNIACMCQSIEINNNKHILLQWRHMNVMAPPIPDNSTVFPIAYSGKGVTCCNRITFIYQRIYLTKSQQCWKLFYVMTTSWIIHEEVNGYASQWQPPHVIVKA